MNLHIALDCGIFKNFISKIIKIRSSKLAKIFFTFFGEILIFLKNLEFIYSEPEELKL